MAVVQLSDGSAKGTGSGLYGRSSYTVMFAHAASDQFVRVSEFGPVIKCGALGLALPQVGQRISPILLVKAPIGLLILAITALTRDDGRMRRFAAGWSSGNRRRASPHSGDI